jgi:hypothetical protein
MIFPVAREVGMRETVEGMYAFSKKAHALTLGESLAFFSGPDGGIGEEESVVRGFIQEFVREEVFGLTIASGVEAVVEKVELGIDAVEVIGEEEFHWTSIPA